MRTTSTGADRLSAFFSLNRKLSDRLEARFGLPDDKWIWRRFESDVKDRLRDLSPTSTFVDLGGGRRCVYAGALGPDSGVRVVTVDISPTELRANRDVACRVAADVTRGLALAPGSVDLLASRALLEHVESLEAAADATSSILRPGGTSVHLLPCRFSLFGLAARILPFKPLLRLLHLAMPESIGQVEFDIFYDHGTPARCRRAFLAAGYRKVDVDPCWAQADYFRAVTPLFVAVHIYDAVMRSLRLKPFASYMMVTATA